MFIFDVLRQLRQAFFDFRRRSRESKVYMQTGGAVVSGPFIGMQLILMLGQLRLAHKLLGTYELELFPFLEEIIKSDYDIIINLGAGDGYYAIGLLRNMPNARLVAYESSKERRNLILDNARRNGVEDRLVVRGNTRNHNINDYCQSADRLLVVCDIEGYEKEVLASSYIANISQADILVEIHNFVDAATSSVIRERFSVSHGIETVCSRKRTSNDLSVNVGWPMATLLEIVDEGRPTTMEWFWLKSKEDLF